MYNFVPWSGPAVRLVQLAKNYVPGSGGRGRVGDVSPRPTPFPYSGRNSEERYPTVGVHPIVFVSLAYFFELLDRLTHNLKRRGLYSFLPLVWRGETIRILRYRISGWNTPHDVSCWIPERRGTTHNEHRQSVTSTLYAPTRKLGSNGSRRWPLKGSLSGK